MTAILFEGDPVKLLEGESVLDALLREGHDIPNGCRSGVCQSCLLSSDGGKDLSDAQKGLSEAQKQLNFFLGCQCQPTDAITVKRVAAGEGRVDASVIDKCWLNDAVISLTLKADLDFRAGQFVTLWNQQGTARSYSLANPPRDDGTLELHIKRYSDGVFSSWVADSLQVGDSLQIQGPMGECFYTGAADQPMLLGAIGTGLAPIWGVLQDALAQGHSGSIELLIGAKRYADFYLLDSIRELVDANDNVNLHLLCQEETSETVNGQDIYAYVKDQFADLKGYKVFLCGAESFIKKMRRQCFMAGAGMSDIAADVFLPFGQ